MATLLLTIRKFNVPSPLSEIFFYHNMGHFDLVEIYFIALFSFNRVLRLEYKFLREIFLTGKYGEIREMRLKFLLAYPVKENNMIFEIIIRYFLIKYMKLYIYNIYFLLIAR